MKLHLLFVLLFPILVIAQQKTSCPTIIVANDFVESNNQIEIKSKVFYLIDASEDCIKTKLAFICTKRQFSTLTISQINLMLVYANIEVMTHMKNKYSYVPKRIDVTFSERINKWIFSIDYLAQNDYGGTVNNVAHVQFTSTGDYYNTEF